MEKLYVVSLDEEYEDLQKSKPVVRKQQWTKKTKTGKLTIAHRKKMMPNKSGLSRDATFYTEDDRKKYKELDSRLTKLHGIENNKRELTPEEKKEVKSLVRKISRIKQPGSYSHVGSGYI